jgi:hypothetical protein
MARAADEPVAPFGATRAGVTGLVPEARLVPGDALVEGRYGVTEAQVDRWLDELSGDVSVRLDGWERLTNVAVLDTTGGEPVTLIEGDRDRVRAWAAGVIHNGAASYLEAARHPERSSVNSDSYSAVLWDRYTTGLDRVAAWLTGRLDALEPGDVEEPAPEYAGPAYSFPTPLIGDRLRF